MIVKPNLDNTYLNGQHQPQLIHYPPRGTAERELPDISSGCECFQLIKERPKTDQDYELLGFRYTKRNNHPVVHSASKRQKQKQKGKVLLSFDSSQRTGPTSSLALPLCTDDESHQRNIDETKRRVGLATTSTAGAAVGGRNVRSQEWGASTRPTTPLGGQRRSAPESYRGVSPDRTPPSKYSQESSPTRSMSEIGGGGGGGDDCSNGYLEIQATCRDRLPKCTPPPPTPAGTSRGARTTNYKSSARVRPRQRDDSQTNCQVFFSGGGGATEYSTPMAGESKPVCYALSLAAGLLVGVIVYIMSVYHLNYSVLAAVVLGGAVACVLGVILVLFRICRCVLVLLLPSFCTGGGRVAFVAFMIGCLLGGPVTNVYFNMQVK